MKKIAILAMSLLIAGAVFAQTPQAPVKKEAVKTEKKCCDKKNDKKECTGDHKDCKKACNEKKGEKKACCAEKKAEKKSCCAEKKAEKKS